MELHVACRSARTTNVDRVWHSGCIKVEKSYLAGVQIGTFYQPKDKRNAFSRTRSWRRAGVRGEPFQAQVIHLDRGLATPASPVAAPAHYSGRQNSSKCVGCARVRRGRIKGGSAARDEFRRSSPCPSTGRSPAPVPVT